MEPGDSKGALCHVGKAPDKNRMYLIIKVSFEMCVFESLFFLDFIIGFKG